MHLTVKKIKILENRSKITQIWKFRKILRIRKMLNFQIKNIPIIICLEWGKDKLSFPIWASDLNVVKSGDHKGFKFTIKEVLAQHY